MKRVLNYAVIGAFIVVMFAGSVFAGGEFNITYRHQNTVSQGPIYSGVLMVNVHNISGQDARDVVVWIEGANSITFDGRKIFVGNLSNGSQREAVSRFEVPAQLAAGGVADDFVAWNVEFTNPSGNREVVSVAGGRVR